MKRGRLKKIKMRKRFSRRRFGAGARRAGNPKQRAAALVRARVRRTRGR